MSTSTSITPKTIRTIVRATQGAWRWQTPYRVHTYAAYPGADGVLRWQRTGTSAKYTLARIEQACGETDGFGGLHGQPVTTPRERDEIYSDDTH